MKDWITGAIETVVLGLGIALSWVKLSQKIEDDLQDLNKWRAVHMIESAKRDSEIVQLKIMSARQEEVNNHIKENGADLKARLDRIIGYLERQSDSSRSR